MGAIRPCARLDSCRHQLSTVSYVDPAFCNLQNLFAVGSRGGADTQGPTLRSSCFHALLLIVWKLLIIFEQGFAFSFCTRPCKFGGQSQSYPLTTISEGVINTRFTD